MPDYVTLTEAVSAAIQQYEDEPTSLLSHTLEHFAASRVGVDQSANPPVADVDKLCRRWVKAGFLISNYTDPTLVANPETPESAFAMWLTARTFLNYPQE